MAADALETFLLGLPAARLSVQWGNDHVFKVGGKMFAVLGSDGGVSFKTADDTFAILTALPGIAPAPYLARANWVYLRRRGTLPPRDLKAYLTRAHAIVADGLPKKVRAGLGL